MFEKLCKLCLLLLSLQSIQFVSNVAADPPTKSAAQCKEFQKSSRIELNKLKERILQALEIDENDDENHKIVHDLDEELWFLKQRYTGEMQYRYSDYEDVDFMQTYFKIKQQVFKRCGSDMNCKVCGRTLVYSMSREYKNPN